MMFMCLGLKYSFISATFLHIWLRTKASLTCGLAVIPTRPCIPVTPFKSIHPTLIYDGGM